MLNMLLLIREMFYYLKKIFISIRKIKKRLFQNVMQKTPTTANHAAAISYKHRYEAALENLDCLRKGGDSRRSGWLHETQLSRDDI